MCCPTVPQEILDTITDTVATLHRSSLPRLALVSQHHFLHRSQSHLFRALKWTPFAGYDPPLCSFEGNLALLSNVRSFSLITGRYDQTSDTGVFNKLALVVSHLHNIRSLKINMQYENFDYLYPTTRQIILKLLEAPVVHLQLFHCVQFPIELVCFLPHLRELTGNHTALVSTNEGCFGGAFRNLDTLVWSGGRIPLLLWDIIPTSSYHNLRYLALRMRFGVEENAGAWEIISAASQSVQLYGLDLIFDFIPKARQNRTLERVLNDWAGKEVGIPSSQSLRYLKLEMVLHGPVDSEDSMSTLRFCTDYASRLLRNTSQSSLEVLHVSASVKIPPYQRLLAESDKHHLRSSLSSQDQWSILDASLSNRQLYPALRMLRVSLQYLKSQWGMKELPADVMVDDETLLSCFPQTKAMVPLILSAVSEKEHEFNRGVEMVLDGVMPKEWF